MDTAKQQTPVRTTPFPQWPSYSEAEALAVADVIRSGKVNYWNGQVCREFERKFAEFVQVEHAIAVSNGTVALELALRALGVGEGDEVIVTPRSFVASASCVVAVGAKPVFADIDPISHNITATTIKQVMTPKTKAVIAVHLAGWPCDMDPIMALAQEHDLKVIEDCAQAHGALYKGRPIGSIGHMSAFSFCTDKIMTLGGEGGMVVTNDSELWRWAWSYKDHGKSYDTVYNKQHPPGFRWLHEGFGTNWRMTEMQAAIGLLQLEKLPEWVEKRRANAAILDNAFSQIPALQVLKVEDDLRHAYYKHYALVKPEMLKDDWSRDRILSALNEQGVPGLSGSCSEMYLEKAFDNGLRPKERLPVAKDIGERSLMFMVHPTMSEDDIQDIVAAVSKVFEQAQK